MTGSVTDVTGLHIFPETKSDLHRETSVAGRTKANAFLVPYLSITQEVKILVNT